MKVEILEGLLKSLTLQTDFDDDINIGMHSKYINYEISIDIDFEEPNPVMSIEYFGYTVFGKFYSQTLNDFEFAAFQEKLEIQRDKIQMSRTEGEYNGFTSEDYNLFEQQIHSTSWRV